MAWNKINQWSLRKILLPLFIGMVLAGCAGTDSSVSKTENDNPNLFNAQSPVVEILASRMPEIARSVFKGVLDSVPGEYYYDITGSRIDSLLKKENGQYKTIVSIVYDSLNDISSFEMRKDDERYFVENGVLMTEYKLSKKYYKEFWSNGKIKIDLTGNFRIDDESGFSLDSGHSEHYFESGKIKELNDWKDGKLITSKQWNDDGVLVVELEFPKYVKLYWDNGKPQSVSTGFLYRDDQGVFGVDSGRSEVYFENGKINELNDWKNKLLVASKQWNEDGKLIKELDFPKYFKECWANGNPQIIMSGLIYRDEQGNFGVDSGHSEIYFENGKIKQQNDWKNKQVVTSKEWDENGLLVMELDSLKSVKTYWSDGKIKMIKTGLLYKDNKGDFALDSGHSEVYFENGKIKQQNDWKDKQLVVSKEWNENGVPIIELDFPKIAKDYWDNGKLKGLLEGLLYKDSHGAFVVDSGRSEAYYENGKIKEQNNWINKQPIAQKKWNENGMLVSELDFPKYYKGYWNNGKPQSIMTGVLYRDDQGVIKVENGRSEYYYENGKIKEKNEWKDRQFIASKKWNENGVLVSELSFPKYFKEYWDNGKIRVNSTGVLYKDNQGAVQVETGRTEVYYENGKINMQADWKDKQLFASKKWNEKGVLVTDIEFPKYVKEYWDNGKPKNITTGRFYRGSQGGADVDSGRAEMYFESGKIKQQIEWKDKQPFASKQWNENGVLTEDTFLPNYSKIYNDQGQLSEEASGTIEYTNGKIVIKNGFYKKYTPDGVYRVVYRDYKEIQSGYESENDQ